jgi:hypothetical protein
VEGKEVSQDKLVTPWSGGSNSASEWLGRSLSLAAVPLLRLRQIEKLYGSLRRVSDRCGCQNESRHPSPSERAVLWCALQPLQASRQVLLSTPCRLVPAAWLVLSPNGGLFSWAEIWELSNTENILNFEDSFDPLVPRTLSEWEGLGKNEIRFKICQNQVLNDAAAIEHCRFALVREVIQRNPNYSHVNLSLELSPKESGLDMAHFGSNLPDFEIESLRERYVPSWRQSGDMAYRKFSAYTITRKDI